MTDVAGTALFATGADGLEMLVIGFFLLFARTGAILLLLPVFSEDAVPGQIRVLIAVGMTAAKMLLFVVLLIMVSGCGLLLGVAKAWIETAPELDLSVFNSQAQTSFIYDKYGTLVTEFSGTENRINVARQRYNKTVEEFNGAIRKFPASLTNSILLHLDRKEYFKADEAAKVTPQVKF